ncbi:MAG: phosphoribosylamine--glycine ligase [Planctomycetota bacterium]
MKILVVGSGGREHALCWKLASSPRGVKVYCAPGNAGTAELAENVPIPAADIDGLLAFAKREAIELTVVGPEDPLCAGIADRFEDAGLRVFGPCAAAARLEGDKSYAKQLMRGAGVPTAEARIFGPTKQEIVQAGQPSHGEDEATFTAFQRGYDMAREYVVTRDEGVVVKASGLAAGKGVFVHPDPSAALLTLENLMVKRKLGVAGERVVIEELLTGPEVSILALVDGQTIYVLESATDYKRVGEGDTGPNTGGMGSYSPSHVLSEPDLAIVEKDVLVPIVDALRREGVTYRGALYAGLIMTAGGPKVLEFNCRFGDPETQPVLMRLKSDLVDALEATVEGRLSEISLDWNPRAAVCVVMASGGYPNAYEKGKVISGLAAASGREDIAVFHAGTALSEGEVVTSGGRVLGVTALGDSVEAARQCAYEAVKKISFDTSYVRGDIAAGVAARC